MFGNIGPADLVIIMALALLVFGPKKLPEIGKSIGNAMREFRKASSEFMDAMHHSEPEQEEPRPPVKSIEYPTYPETPALAGGESYEAMPYGADFYPTETVPQSAVPVDEGVPPQPVAAGGEPAPAAHGAADSAPERKS